jgi:hypothetical protein
MLRVKAHTTLSALFLLCWTGCVGDLPRDNPLDPRSDQYQPKGRIEGLITRQYPPYPPLAGVMVYLWPEADTLTQGRTTRSNATGRFTFDGIPPGRYRLWVQAAGYRALQDTQHVEVFANQTLTTTFRLNALPYFAAYMLTTVHISRWWPQTDLYRLEVEAHVIDPDDLRDVIRVWLKIPVLQFVDTLQSLQPAGRFFSMIPAEALPTSSLHALLGYDLYLGALDRNGDTVYTPALRLSRIIDPVPTALEPRGLAVVDTTQPLLRWERLSMPFAFTYRIDVVRREADVDIPIVTLDNLSARRDSVRIPQPLAPGVYYWTVSVVDAFGNRSRSKEAGFQVP